MPLANEEKLRNNPAFIAYMRSRKPAPVTC